MLGACDDDDELKEEKPNAILAYLVCDGVDGFSQASEDEEDDDESDDDDPYTEATTEAEDEDSDDLDSEYGSLVPKRLHSNSRLQARRDSRALRLNPYFLIVSFGYMAPWTVMGSLIETLKFRYGPDFFVKLNCAYYLPGLPVSILQLYVDEKMDKAWGSARSYLWRNVVGFLVIIGAMVAIPIADENPEAKLFFTAIIGVFSWLCHGTATMLASMFPSASLAWLQTGFRMPEVYTLIMVASFHIGPHPSEWSVDMFFYVTSLVVGCGLIAWFIITRSAAARTYFRLKDGKVQGPGFPQSREVKNVVSASSPPNGGTSFKDMVSSGSNKLNKRGHHHRAHHHHGVRSLTENEKALIETAVWPCRIGIFITMWASIFQASFFAHVNSVSGSNISMILYFVRLFSDLAGRPLTRIHPRPFFLETPWQLVKAAVCRLLLMVVFFLYIVVPTFPQSDFFICSLVGAFSILSGYFSVLSYEYAARQFECKAYQAYAGTVMNMTFQMAAFTAVISGLLFLDLDLLRPNA